MTEHEHVHLPPEEWFSRVHKAAVDRLETVWEAQSALDEDPDNELAQDALGLFCGCSDCIVREVLTAGAPILLHAAHIGDLADL